MGSDSLFLEQVSIANFRAYPSEFTLSLPPGPGVTVLSGPNGLGKTSFFEAIEWALTANVKRLSALTKNKLEARYLLRQSSGGSCEVSLIYSNGVHIRRLQTIGKAGTVVGNDLSEVAELIRARDLRWSVTSNNLADYLHLTHFHPQAAELRLVSLDPDERWLRVSPLAGADRFDRLRANLRTARTGLTRSINTREQDVGLAKERHASWVRRVEEFRTISLVDRAAHGAMSPRDALGALGPIARVLQQRIPEASDASSTQVAELLAHLKSRLDDAIGKLRIEEVRLRALSDLPATWTRALASHESAVERKARAQDALTNAEARMREAQRIASERTKALDRGITKASQADQRHRTAVALQGHQDALSRSAVQNESLKSLRERQEETVKTVQLTLQSEIAAHSEFQANQVSRKALEEAIASTRSALTQLSDSFELERQLGQQRQRVSQRSTQLDNIRAAYSAFEVELRSTRQQRAAIVARLETEAERLGELARAVTTIAAHLTDRDDTCPVCKSAFEHGRLRERALQQSVASSEALTSLQQELETANRNVTYLEAKGTELLSQIRAAEQEIASLTAITVQLRARIDALRSNPMIGHLEGAEKRLSAQLAGREADLSALLLRIESSPTEQELAARASNVRLALSDATRDLDATRAQLDKLAADRSDTVARIAAARRTLGIPETTNAQELVTRLAQERVLAEGERVAASEAASLAQADCDVATRELEAARQLLVGASAETTRGEAELKALQARWTQAGLSEPLSESSLQEAILAVASRQAELTERSPAVSIIGTGLEEWQRLDASRRLQAALVSEAGGRSIEEYGATLQSAVAAAERRLKAAQEAYDASEKLFGAVRQIGEGFGRNAIAPFAEVFKGFLRALVRDTRFHRVNPEFARTKGGGNTLRFNLDLSGSIEASGFQVELVLSEGQLSEVSLAAMLAASCIYRWSRWRGVLLDDPTQYQDLTHSTSLFEVIRNLAVDAGFQVIVAVHDRAQADFLVRKLMSASVPFVECEYLAIGPHGALTRVSGSTNV